MDDYAYSREKSAPAGSDLYYSSLFYDQQKKNRLFTLFAFATTLSEISDRVTDPGVANIKLKWWHEEVERIFNQNARHPVGKALANINRINPLDESWFHQLISFEERKMSGFKVRITEDLLEILKQGPGLLWEICVKNLGYIHASTPDSAQQTACLLAYYNILQNCRHDTGKGYLYLPLEDLESAGISQQHFPDKDSDSTREFFYKQIRFLIKHLDINFLGFPVEDKLNHIHVRIMNRLQHGLCKAVLSDNCNLLTRKTILTPLHKLWIAWFTKIKT